MILSQSTAKKIPFFMRDQTDSISGLTGLTPTVTLSKDGGSFAAAGGSVTEIGSGWYYLSANTTDTATLGALLLHATATGADIWDEAHQVGPVDANVLTLVAAAIQSIWDALTSALTTTGSIGKLISTDLDAAISTRLATSGYTAPDNADIVAIKAKTDNLPATPASQGDVTTVGTNVTAIKAKTDNLPATPASQGDVTTVGTTATAIKAKTDNLPATPASQGDVTTVGTTASAIKAKTDNLPSDPASESLVEAAATAIYNRLGAPAGASTAADIAAVNTDTAAIKAKTDNLPGTPASQSDVTTVGTNVTAIKAKTDNLPSSPAASAFKKNTALAGFQFQMFDTAGVPATGLTVVVKVSKDGGALSTSSNSATELSLGWYTIDITSGEMNAKNIALNFAATGATTYGQVLTTEG